MESVKSKSILPKEKPSIDIQPHFEDPGQEDADHTIIE
jgi:hypothetical protein